MNRMFSPVQNSLITWVLVLVASGLTISAFEYIGELISILVTAGLIAFILNYAVAKLQRLIPRGLAAALVYLVAALVVIVIAVTVVPPVIMQGRQLITRLPDLIESGKQQLAEFQAWGLERSLPIDVGILQQKLLVNLQGKAEAIAATSLGLVVGTFNWFIDFILILVIAFYMLLDGERLWDGITSFLSPKVRYIFTDCLARNLQGFVVGQFILGLFMAVSLTISFFLLKVPFFLLFAVFIGILEVIPFVGATLGIGTVTIIVAFIDWWLALQVLLVAIIFQQIKDNLVTPRIMGNITGLSPVIIFSSLLLGGRIGGLLGIILAIPLTGVVKSIFEVILDPASPPQTGSFFTNPLDEVEGENNNSQKTEDKSSLIVNN
ncbi:AI-2E family transporter [Lyngbya sp. PCC 8106]|uniref:AI-2E family transporter n=1 Tax=Lyngbya sp. (strain PCC 8106) TaxID=313612 RepID=UPI0005878BF8|nr:AI-2E family transporter [Lyngbya sp. PCC 8106]